MAKYNVDVTVSDEAPSMFVSLDIGTKHIDTARNSDGDWEGTAEGLELDLPAEFLFTARGLPSRPYTLAITLTPSDGSAEVDYTSRDTKLSKRGYTRLEDAIKAS